MKISKKLLIALFSLSSIVFFYAQYIFYYPDEKIENIIYQFYKSNRQRLGINLNSNGLKFDKFCILVPYQNNLENASNDVTHINEFLLRKNLQQNEGYWHIVIIDGDTYSLHRISQKKSPLLTPANYLNDSCFDKNEIVIKKYLDIQSGNLYLTIGE